MSSHKRWMFMSKFEVPYFDKANENYLTRWRIFETPVLSLYLHRFDNPDSRPTLHDHPWNFLSFILRGGYVERRLDTRTLDVDEHHHIRRWNYVTTRDAHSIMTLDRSPTWSLLLVGPRVRTWGYWERLEAPGTWRWTEFDKHSHSDEFERAMAERKAGSV